MTMEMASRFLLTGKEDKSIADEVAACSLQNRREKKNSYIQKHKTRKDTLQIVLTTTTTVDGY